MLLALNDDVIVLTSRHFNVDELTLEWDHSQHHREVNNTREWEWSDFGLAWLKGEYHLGRGRKVEIIYRIGCPFPYGINKNLSACFVSYILERFGLEKNKDLPEK